MKINLNYKKTKATSNELVLVSSFSKEDTKKDKKNEMAQINHWPKNYQDAFKLVKSSDNFKGKVNNQFFFHLEDGTTILALGLGEKKKLKSEILRKAIANAYKGLKNNTTEMSILVDSFVIKSDLDETLQIITESLGMTSYEFNKHKSTPNNNLLKQIHLDTSKTKNTSLEKTFKKAQTLFECVNFGRDLVNEPPNILNSETFSKLIEKDIKNIKRVKAKILNRVQLKKEKMNLFLSVNAGSNYEPRLVHLTYSPKKTTSKTKHIALVGKGLTFDTGGYSLKPSASMANMKFDMAGAATVYAAFKAACLNDSDAKITCILGMTDNAIGPKATMPDSIIKARNGKSVEILNTDAEGRLVLADCLDYCCDLKPDVIIDAATLTGACLVALGTEICGLMSNDEKLSETLMKSSKKVDEYMWRLPIISEFRDDIKSPNADLKNISSARFGGTAKAAAFLENFIKNDIPWAHLDIAGIGDAQGHLPYCPSKGGSGLIVRSLAHYLANV